MTQEEDEEGNWNCAKRDAQRVPRQLGVAMGARAADPRCAADPHLFSPASAAAFLRATSRRRVAAEQLVVRCAGPADASAAGGLKCAMAALTALMSCGARAAAAYVRCSPSRGAGLSRRLRGRFERALYLERDAVQREKVSFINENTKEKV